MKSIIQITSLTNWININQIVNSGFFKFETLYQVSFFIFFFFAIPSFRAEVFIEYYQQIFSNLRQNQQCSLPRVGCARGANTFPSHNQSRTIESLLTS